MSTDSDAPDAPVLITAANRNVGAHLANRFIDDGFAVIAHYRSETDEIHALKKRGAHLVQGEFADADSIMQIVAQVQAIAPRLRAVVHNASAFSPTASKPAEAAAQFQAFFEVHMLAPYLINSALAASICGPDSGAGDIVHITDIYADNPGPQYDIYCATKAGLQNLSLSFAKRLGPRVKVNAIQPGPISFEAWVGEDEQRDMLDNTPLGRAGSPEAIYKAVRAFMDNPYQTGAVVAVDGGRRLGR